MNGYDARRSWFGLVLLWVLALAGLFAGAGAVMDFRHGRFHHDEPADH